MKYIVRADYYPSGEILPIGITDEQGNSTYIKDVVKTHRFNYECCVYECITNNKKVIHLRLEKNKWIVEFA